VPVAETSSSAAPGAVAWKVADQLGWADTFDAEYIALTQLQADAFITLDRQLAHAVQHLVTVAPIEALSGSNKSTYSLTARTRPQRASR
jgi:hypothetical protein